MIGMVRGNKLHTMHNDHLGRPEVITDSTKKVVWKSQNTSYDSNVIQSSIGAFNIGFPGQYYDVESNLWYNWNRYYDATIGRYTQSDPIGLAGGLNTYAYVGNNPVGAVDWMGLVEANLFGSKDPQLFHQGIASLNTANDKTVLNIGAHANANGIQYYDPSKPAPQLANTPAALHSVLNQKGYADMVKRIEQGEKIEVNFLACNVDTSSMVSNRFKGKTFAQRYSEAYPNAIVNAPNGFAAYANNGSGVLGYRTVQGGKIFDAGVNTLINGYRVSGPDALIHSSPSSNSSYKKLK